jgi:SPP1 family predicted phage head-tail adaptor
VTAQHIQPGDLNRRLVLEGPVETPDGAGGVTRSFATVATVWAQLTPVAARAHVAADGLAAIATHRIVIRAGRTINTLNRFRDGTRIFRIVSYRDTADRRFLEIDAEEQKD